MWSSPFSQSKSHSAVKWPMLDGSNANGSPFLMVRSIRSQFLAAPFQGTWCLPRWAAGSVVKCWPRKGFPVYVYIYTPSGNIPSGNPTWQSKINNNSSMFPVESSIYADFPLLCLIAGGYIFLGDGIHCRHINPLSRVNHEAERGSYLHQTGKTTGLESIYI